MVVHKTNKPNYQRGISQKAGVVLSYATGIFLKHLAQQVVNQSPEGFIKRKLIVNILLRKPAYRFSMVRMKPVELFEVFTEKSELSRKITARQIEMEIKFPIEFIAPNPPEKPFFNEAKANQREAENSEAVIRAAITANQAYQQSVPSFFFRSKAGH
ncbi:hypothetical protein TRFO_08362 [Tritrichomonas foetus]|uniref:Uncharacterized protein n=1 Tax=Tritrichomonas foetus TaxID=1144522 RepID=A0A1J4JJU8_9EUKA|nr:hypothetical protein TRFO_08362 [Tritrichomonas foetus]|eukprot:OHS99438.1 hypothetical protein TRFO_08362 [Tritrichomonas foetus]